MLGERRPRATTANTAAAGADDRTPAVPSAALTQPDIAGPHASSPAAAAPGSAWRDPVPWAIASLVFCGYFTLSLYRLLQLNPASYDLGIYTEYVKQLSQLHAPVVDILAPGFNLLGNHFQVGVAVLAPFFRAFPSPATLLFFQALAVAVSVFPVTTAGTALAGRTAGRLIGFAYGFSWGLQQMINADFHEIALAVPLLAFSLSALVRRRPAAAICWAMPLVFIEEDQGFSVAAIGLLLVLSALRPRLLAALSLLPSAMSGRGTGEGFAAWGDGSTAADRVSPEGYRHTALWGGVFLVGWGVFWTVFAITVFIPHFNPVHQYYFWKDGGVVGGGARGSFSPGRIAVQLGHGWSVKLRTTVVLLLPTAFAALCSPVALIGLPGLALRFVSTNTAYWGTDWQYNATIMPVLFIAAAEAIGRWQRLSRPAGAEVSPPATRLAAWVIVRRGVARHGPAMMAAIAVAFAFQFPLNNLWHGDTYRIDAHVQAADAAMAVVPDGATVQTTLGMLAPLAARTDTFWIGTAGNPLTQYVVFDNNDSGYSPAIKDVPAFIAGLYPHDGYVEVFERDYVYVFRRT
ncbi:DUF2079 domain-containing protein [Trebonia kvetii]|uniref:DUF2079 domain-containing protein n=1 Tax=Trebonia kvetii TaxID=2480626 RepID=A0A6P2BWP0_9ACTN|nr:DUF2079 domain-containing protein [Trebonia kvetii]TVZ03330.1 DUF2079 domain-containing protein [Trebonia kvetii]